MECSATELLAELDHRWERAAAEGCRRCSVDLCGRLIELHFPAGMPATLIEGALRGRRAQAEGRPEAVFRFWAEEHPLPAGLPPGSGVYAYREPDGRGVYRAGSWLLGIDPLRGEYSCCCRPEDSAPLPYWLMSLTAGFWAEGADLLPMHGAAIGLEGRGVLIAAGGGGGKSTLAVSCLLAGMELVSDDFLLLTARGPLRAMPLFSAVKLNPDMAERLQPGLPVLWRDRDRGGKQLLDASGWALSSGLDIDGVVFPCLGDRTELVPARGPLSLRLVRSGAGQAGGASRLRALTERLSGLPAFELRLGADTGKNAAALMDLIKKGF